MAELINVESETDSTNTVFKRTPSVIVPMGEFMMEVFVDLRLSNGTPPASDDYVYSRLGGEICGALAFQYSVADSTTPNGGISIYTELDAVNKKITLKTVRSSGTVSKNRVGLLVFAPNKPGSGV